MPITVLMFEICEPNNRNTDTRIVHGGNPVQLLTNPF